MMDGAIVGHQQVHIVHRPSQRPIMQQPAQHQGKAGIDPTSGQVFPPTESEFTRLYGRPPTTDAEVEHYHPEGGDAAPAQPPNLTPLEPFAKLPETEPIARKGAGYVGSAEEAGDNASRTPEEMEDTYGATFRNLATGGKPTIVWNPDLEKSGSVRNRETLIHEMGHAGVMMNQQLHDEFKRWFAYPNFEELRQRTADVDRLSKLSSQLRKSGKDTTEIDKLLGETRMMQGIQASKVATSRYEESGKKKIQSLTSIIKQSRKVNRRANQLARQNKGFSEK